MSTVEKAINFAVKAHKGMQRKSKTRPFILHPLEAMLIVSTITEDEDVLAAAVLHDVIEDTPYTKQDIEKEFGKRIADLVDSESENKREGQDPKETWMIRKRETIEHLSKSSREVKLICLGDKLANLREMARDYRKNGKTLWEVFNSTREMQNWYYWAVLSVLKPEFEGTPAIKEYEDLLRELF